ncbi:hypothetical protein KRR26_07120 [Corallococcus sp. M34]|nr:hypothetical protein [Citreicoccus inhibens]MBU8895369.1 hypothetical protein [Citreicoccus inhibens]
MQVDVSWTKVSIEVLASTGRDTPSTVVGCGAAWAEATGTWVSTSAQC